MHPAARASYIVGWLLLALIAAAAAGLLAADWAPTGGVYIAAGGTALITLLHAVLHADDRSDSGDVLVALGGLFLILAIGAASLPIG